MSRKLEGFLTCYCQELTGLETTSLKRLFLAVENDSPRAAEPLLLLALAQGRTNYLLKQANGTLFQERYEAFLEDFEQSGKPLGAYLTSLPEGNRYAKAYRAWVSETERLERDRATLGKVAAAMLETLDRKGLTRAEACRALDLDKGNFYAFLKGDSARLSRSTAMAAYRKLAAL